MNTTRDLKLVESFVNSMKESIRYFANGKLTEDEVSFLAEHEVNRLDFENEWQMHKGIGYFAKRAVKNYIANKEVA